VTIADQLLPTYQFSERHQSVVAADPARVRAGLETLDDNDAVMRALIALRELPSRIAGALGARNTLWGKPPFGLSNFTPLMRSESEIAYGLIGRFWQLDYGLEPVTDAAAFIAFDKPATPKLVLGFQVLTGPNGGTRLVTETRVYCPDRAALLRFTPYWWIIRAASGFIRRRLLTAVKRRAEQTGNSGGYPIAPDPSA
jgi:hypothetical protein